MDNQEINVEKLAAELAGNTLIDETSVNDQTYQQIVAFLKTDKMNKFRYVILDNMIIIWTVQFDHQVTKDPRGAREVHLQARSLLAHPPVHQEEWGREQGGEGRRSEQTAERCRQHRLQQPR